MIVFGVPDPDHGHCFHSLACGGLFQKFIARLNEERIERGLFPVLFRVGVNTGQMLAGNMGSSERMNYTVIGDSVNMAARLCSAAEPGQMVVTEEVYQMEGISDRTIAEVYKPMRLRGRGEPVRSFAVTDVIGEYRSAMEDELAAIMLDVLASGS
jgi:adenylate cyclase